MKKYHICFLLLLGTVSLCLASGFFFLQARSEKLQAQTEEIQENEETMQETETTPPEEHMAESTAKEDDGPIHQAAVAQDQVRAKGNLFLVSEDGFCWYLGGTHRRSACIPISRSRICQSRSGPDCARGSGSPRWKRSTAIWNPLPADHPDADEVASHAPAPIQRSA